MNNTQEHKFNLDRVGMVAAILFALLLLYVLSIGPVALICDKTHTEPRILRQFYYPLIWLHDNTALRKPLEMYLELWGER